MNYLYMEKIMHTLICFLVIMLGIGFTLLCFIYEKILKLEDTANNSGEVIYVFPHNRLFNNSV